MKPTLGPWWWRANSKTQQVHLFGAGWMNVMDFTRWGMRGAQPRFRDEENLMQKVSQGDPDYNGDIKITHPDALLIAAAPEMLEALECAYKYMVHAVPQAVDEIEKMELALCKAKGISIEKGE